MLTELRFAARRLLRDRSTTLAAVVAVALGAAFTVAVSPSPTVCFCARWRTSTVNGWRSSTPAHRGRVSRTGDPA